MHDELRKHVRSRVRKGALAAFFLPGQPEALMLGEIVDISEGGLGICYIDIEDRYAGALEVSIHGLDNSVFLSRLPCRIVFDMETPEDPLAILNVRRCGIQFEGISSDQLSSLKEFILDLGGIDSTEFLIWNPTP